jgi:hypothetical protein
MTMGMRRVAGSALRQVEKEDVGRFAGDGRQRRDAGLDGAHLVSFGVQHGVHQLAVARIVVRHQHSSA